MNYLSHYFLDAQSEKPYHNFGLVLPDMMGSSTRGWKPDFDNYIFSLSQHTELILGIKKHHLADAYFHSSAFFTSNTTQIRKIFEENNFTQAGTKLFFVAHIFLEFMLDRLILKNYYQSAIDFYNDLDEVENIVLNDFFTQHKTDSARFFTFLENFRKHQYLFAYLDDERLYYALNRTLQRGKQQDFTDELLPQFSQNIIPKTEELLLPVYEEFFKNMREKMR